MEPKKNLKSDVSRNSSLFFAVGLTLMMGITYLAINYKTYDKVDVVADSLNLDDELEEEVPITEQIVTPPPPPPPPPAAPEIIEVVEDEEEVEETIIESTETEMETEIVEVEDVVVEEVEEDLEVPFSVIENVAVFPGCENKKGNAAKKDCMNEKVNKFIGRKFNTDLAGDLGLPPGKKRIFVQFKVDKSGNVTNIVARGPHPGLEKEAKRVIGQLPKMQPGKQRGKSVVMPFSIPIVFQVQD
ncbi:energy transducer TonB [Winogradskyella psychrotolerans]|uniref:energy transducer TonB n=1 Tax=Winogradskyella psychrotolerans TaxID=1344585 RepID=UPI001C06CC1A|nr:energy transducer TonB [Winogradskyella psychrotolerans]MBU2927017.1 energy transducer TonB [Winogradskyella psychrotolerans]